MSLFKSVATFGGFTFVSRITGFLRDMVLANYLGAGAVSDAFLAAFKIPNLFRSLFAEGAFTTAFVPMLSHKLVSEKREDALNFASKAISALTFFVTLFVIIIEIFMPGVVLLLAPGFADDPGKLELTTTLSRITFPFLLFISIVSFQSGILNSLGKFAAPAAAPVILNLMMIASVFIFVPLSFSPAEGISWSVTFAGFVEILVLRCFLRRQDVRITPYCNIRALIKDSEIITLFKTHCAGSARCRNLPNQYGRRSGIGLSGRQRCHLLALLCQSAPTAAAGGGRRRHQRSLLPILSAHLKSEKIAEARSTQDKAIEYGALLSFPAAVALIVLAEPIVNILFQHGRFNAQDTVQTAAAVIAYSVGLPLYVMVKALSPNFFARGDTKTPVKYSIVVFAFNILFILILMQFFGHVGVACATTLAAFVSFAQYVHGLKKRGYWEFSPQLIRKLGKIVAASLLMGAAILLAEYLLNLWLNDWLLLGFGIKIPILTAICALGVASFCISAKLTGAMDIAELFRLLVKRGKKNAEPQA